MIMRGVEGKGSGERNERYMLKERGFRERETFERKIYMFGRERGVERGELREERWDEGVRKKEGRFFEQEGVERGNVAVRYLRDKERAVRRERAGHKVEEKEARERGGEGEERKIQKRWKETVLRETLLRKTLARGLAGRE